jgi:hypothetical protein
VKILAGTVETRISWPANGCSGRGPHGHREQREEEYEAELLPWEADPEYFVIVVLDEESVHG